jgi:predicted dehydrogenase
VIKLKELIASGRIGKVLSSEVHASGGSRHRETMTSALRYFTDKKIGGNIFTIGLGHRKSVAFEWIPSSS